MAQFSGGGGALNNAGGAGNSGGYSPVEGYAGSADHDPCADGCAGGGGARASHQRVRAGWGLVFRCRGARGDQCGADHGPTHLLRRAAAQRAWRLLSGVGRRDRCGGKGTERKERKEY